MNKLIEEFNIEKNNEIKKENDYDIFPNKEMLENYRQSIIENILDNGYNLENILKEQIISATEKVIEGDNLSNDERAYLYNLVDEDINGYGPLTSLLSDENITEIMVNSVNEIYIETDGETKRDTTVSFINEDHIYRTINKLLESQNQQIDIDNPICETRMPDGSRINIVIPPLTKNPIITIRKYKEKVDKIENLIGDGTLTADMANFIDQAVQSRLNILISGNIGSGKTTLLNAISDLIPTNERIIAIEDIPELTLNNHHIVKMEAKNSNSKELEITTNDLLKTAIRLNPERIILGEVKGVEALTYIETLNSGYKGSIATIYSDNSKDAIKKLELLSSLANKDYPLDTIRELIYKNIDLIIHVEKMKNGHRKITAISIIEKDKNNQIEINDIYTFTINGDTDELNGEYKKNNTKAKMIEKKFNK